MASGIRAAEGALKAGADTMRTYRESLTDELAAIKDKLAGLPSTWTGDGAKEFGDCVEDWFAGTAKTINVLSKFESDLQGSDRSYGATDEAQKATMAGIKNRLNPAANASVR